ncbi:ABC transporter permease [Phenylobacterium montanum]|uniref:Transport permease protein n=1 Tax=Phenylobacterium montanum TaxID=2823693 RepID=A0A975G269_9CAUL|nr:ABC transporter permease [Caulobacter sp. S6]QUD89773.1 ABC transporter permease [Caulobacter sp. S6]
MWDSVRRVFALIRKELLAVLKDARTRNMLMLQPVLQCLLFGYAATLDLSNVPYAAFDRDHSEASAALLAKLDGSGAFHRIANLTEAAQMARLIDNRRVLIVVQIDPNFQRRLSAGEDAPVQVIADGRNSSTAGTAMGYVNTAVESFNADWLRDHGLPPPPVQLVARAWYNANLETRWNLVPALVGTITMMSTLMLAALSVAREREEGTFDQLLVAPYSPTEIMVGKAIPAMLIGVVQATNALLVAQLWFRIPFAGSYVTLYVGLVLFLLAAVGIGLFVSSIAATMQQAMLFAFVVMMPFALLSGMTTPISSMPPIIQNFTLINPLRYAIDLVHRVYLEGVGLDRLVPDLWPMAIIASVTLAGAAWMFRNRLE